MRRPALVGLVLAALLTGCAEHDLVRLAGDDKAGRNNGTAGSTAARQFLIDELKPMATGLNTGASGDAAYLQPFSGGTNVVAVIPGTDLASQYVVVGAHYDGLGSSCTVKTPGDSICNGATDNAAGAAAVLGIARAITAGQVKPRRSVVLAFWDSEEDGLVGSFHYSNNPLVPLAQTVAYVNFDILGANLSPSLRDTSFAIAAESGGARFQEIVGQAIDAETLGTETLSSIFGQNRSDYVAFLSKQVPSVFFSDATGPCYHTSDDEVGIVDYGKLRQQTEIALRVTRELANTANPPAFVSGTPLATYDDALVLFRAIEALWVDRARFSAQDQQTLANIRTDLTRIANEGREAFDNTDVGTLLGHASTVVNGILVKGPCDGFLTPAQEQQAQTVQRFAVR
jgi:hypothetical protein